MTQLASSHAPRSLLARGVISALAVLTLALAPSCGSTPSETAGSAPTAGSVPAGAWIARGTIERTAEATAIEGSIAPAVAARDFERVRSASSRQTDEVFVLEIDGTSWREEWRIAGALPFTETKALRVISSADSHWIVELTNDSGRTERALLVRTADGLLYRTGETTAALQRVPR